MKRPTKVVIPQDEKQPVEKNVLAKAVVDLSRAADALKRSSGLNDKAIIILLSHSSRCNRETVTAVLDSLRNIERDYCR